MGLLKLYNAIETKQFYYSDISTEKFIPPFFASGDQDTIEYTLLTRNLEGGFFKPWRRENPSSYSIKIALYRTSDALELAAATNWADDLINNKKTGKLVQDAGKIATALGSALSVECLFEGEMEDASGNRTTVFQETVLIKKGFITGATLEVPPGDVGASQRWVKGLFMPWVWPAGAEIEAVTPNGTRVTIYVGDDRQLHIEPLT